MTEWQQYVDQIVHELDYDTNEWKDSNVCSAAAIYGFDGSCWAYTAEFPELKEIEVEVDGMDGVKKVTVNEITCAIEAGKGNRSPSEAGIRFGGQKYMLTRKDESGVVQLVSPSGGACVCNIGTACVIALFDKSRSSD